MLVLALLLLLLPHYCCGLHAGSHLSVLGLNFLDVCPVIQTIVLHSGGAGAGAAASAPARPQQRQTTKCRKKTTQREASIAQRSRHRKPSAGRHPIRRDVDQIMSVTSQNHGQEERLDIWGLTHAHM